MAVVVVLIYLIAAWSVQWLLLFVGLRVIALLLLLVLARSDRNGALGWVTVGLTLGIALSLLTLIIEFLIALLVDRNVNERFGSIWGVHDALVQFNYRVLDWSCGQDLQVLHLMVLLSLRDRS